MNLFKTNIAKFALTAFASLVLTACGSSGGSNDNKQPTANNQAGSNIVSNSTTDNKVAQNTTSTNNNTTASANAENTGTPNTTAPSANAGTPNAAAPSANTGAPNPTTPSTNTGVPNTTAPSTNAGAPNTTAPSTNTGTPTTPPATTTPTAFKGITGTGFIVKKSNGDVNHLTINLPNATDINKFFTETGWQLTLLPSTAIDPDIYLENDGIDKKMISGTNYQHTRWGYIENLHTERYLISQGLNPTAIMPSGIATYKGDGIHVIPDPATHTSAIQSTNNFTVDFANKSLTGKIAPTPSVPQFAEVNLSATISGNTFTGNANGIETKGGFYGPQAEELTGSYLKNQPTDGFFGVFGAIKQ